MKIVMRIVAALIGLMCLYIATVVVWRTDMFIFGKIVITVINIVIGIVFALFTEATIDSLT